MPTRGRPELQMSQNDDAGRQQQRQRSSSQQPGGTAGQKRPRRNKSVPPSSTVSGREENENTLIKLSACCRKHALFHNKEAQQQQADENHDNMPPKCLEDLQILTSLLPRVEKKFSAKKRPKPEDVGHLCAFYRDVLKGGYCPYAPQIFRRQDKSDRPDGYKVLHRVHYLFENLMAPKLIAHTVSGALPDEESTNDTPNLHHQKVCQRPTETTWSIERTIAQLLFFLASDQSTTIREDLVQLLMDLAVLAQCDDNMLASSDIQLELFPKTMEELWSEAGDEDDEFVLDIHNRDCILSLQSATLNVLIEWNKQCLAKIIPRVDESNDAVEESTETLDLSSQFSNDSKRDVLAALRPILLGESVSILAERSRSSALELLLHSGLILPRIDMDSNAWSAANGIELDILLEAGLLTVKAVGKLLLRQEQWKQYACKEESLAQSEDVAVGLALLLRQCVLLPPRVSGYCHSEVQDTVCRTSLQSLLDECLPWIRPRGEKHVLVQVQQLEIVTLRTIHACLHANLESRNAFFLSNPIHVVGPLLDLLSEYSSEICDVAVFILRDLLITLSIKVDDLCESVWSHRHSTPQQLWVPQIPPQLKGYCPSSSSKRCDASPMKSSSPVSTSDGNGGRKGKRRTSIFDSSPLSIVSPAAKRLKDTNANQETEACSATPTTETGALSYFVEDLLRSFLISSLQASQRISEYAMSCSSGRIEDPCLPKLDIPHVVASLKVLLVQNAIVSPTQSDNHQPYDYSHPENEVLKRLASGWQEYCYSIATQAEKGSAGWTKEWQALSNVVISCGLFGWYTTRSYRSSSVSPELVEIFISGSLTSSNALALVATAVSNNEKSQNKPTNRSLCRGLCKDIQDGLAFATWGSGTTLMGSHLCPCSLISLETESKAQQHFDDLFQHDCTIMTFLSFPLPIRCCLLSSFVLKVLDASGKESSWKSIQGSKSLFKRLLEPKAFVWNEMTSASVVFSPMAIAASCVAPRRDQSQYGWKSHLQEVTVDYLRNVMLPIVQAKNSNNTAETRWDNCSMHSCLVAVRCIQWLHSSDEEENSNSDCWLAWLERVFDDASLCLSFLCQISFDEVISSTPQDPCQLSIDGVRKEIVTCLMHMEVYAGPDKEESWFETTPPAVRLLCWETMAWECQQTKIVSSSKKLLWLIRAPFSDPDMAVRERTSREIGEVLLGNNFHGLFALFARKEEWGAYFRDNTRGASMEDAYLFVNKVGSDVFQRRRAASDRIVAALFDEIDTLINSFCEETVNISSENSSKTTSSPGRTHSRRVSAVKALSSLCRQADTEETCGKSILEQALLRIVRLLTVASDSLSSNGSIAAASFGELTNLFRDCQLESLVRQNRVPNFLAELLRGIFSPHMGILLRNPNQDGMADVSPAVREKRYTRLFAVFRAILATSSVARISDIDARDAVAFFIEYVLPCVLAEFVVEKDYDCLLLTSGFALFLQNIKKHEKLEAKRNDGMNFGRGGQSSTGPESLLGDPTALSKSRASGVSSSTQDLEHETKLLCGGPKTVEHMMPLILMKADQAALTFYTKVVLQSENTLKDIILMREQLILKMLVLNLGTDPDLIDLAMRAIRAAAIARKQETKGSTAEPRINENDRNKSNSRHRKRIEDSDYSDPYLITSAWVTENFMYIMVNVIQYQWKSKSSSERLRAIRCLNVVLSLLCPENAPQYFPQIMAAVNAAINGRVASGEGSGKELLEFHRLRLLAVQALSKFCQIVYESNWEILGQNLTSVVVSLIPIVNESDQKATPEAGGICRKSERLAVEFLEWLTSTKGQTGKNLAVYFKDIPFLPATANLDGVRAALKRNGVDFDNFLIMTQNTENYAPSRESHSEVGSLCSTDSRILNPQQQAALTKRINIVCLLLNNENVGIRKVVLQHLVDLLRSHRSVFHALVENEGGTSIGRFLTVSYTSEKVSGNLARTGKAAGGESFSSGVVTRLMKVLLVRCVHETEPYTKEILGACLGEVGAISGQRLGMLSLSTELGASDSLDSEDSAWRLMRPPWMVKGGIKDKKEKYSDCDAEVGYGFKLVEHLVVALRAAPTSAEQHKIAFPIQELLQLLNNVAEDSLAETINVVDNQNRPPMCSWLREKLESAGVIESVEPFWHSDFRETEGFAAKDKGPPFFRGATSHYFWLSRWCSYMVKRSNEKRAGPWSSLFFACRTAFRTPVGLRIAEFIAPLLVLDGLCFGDQSDRKTIVEELRDVFVTEETAGSLNVRLNHSEHRKAVNTAFMIIETLQYWAETRTEEVHNQSKRSSASNGSNVNAGSWSSDDSTFQIDEMLTKISLLLQAKAAASVGMHARALRLVEMAARANLVEEVYDASVSDQKTTSPKCKWRSSRSFGNHRLFDIDMDLLKNVLAELNDCDTMGALEEDGSNSNPIERTLDSIRQNEASGNWEGALRDYERIQQLQGLQGCDIRMKKGALRCLLELGQFESVINQVRGISASVELLPDDEGQRKATKAAQVKPLAVEASWRLGKWSTLSGLIDQDGLQSESGRHLDSEGIYRIANGEAMLALYKKDPESVSSAVRIARQAVMDGLSNVARESYSRAYPFLVRLHCLRELEDTKDFLCDKSIPDDLLGGVAADCVSRESWNWQRRLDLVAPSSAGPVISTRLAVARLSGDYALEGSLLLSAGKKARKNGLFNIASDLLAQAEASLNTMSRDACEKGADSLLGKINMQLAKLRHDSGQSSAALKMLGEESVHHLIELKKEDADKIIVAQETYTFGHNAAHPDNAGLVQRFACRVLQSTKWMIEGGLKDGAEIINRFKVVVKVAPRMEKGHIQFAKYIDSIIQSRAAAFLSRQQIQSHPYYSDEDVLRADAILRDKAYQGYVLLAMDHYLKALELSLKHVYQALPRLLSLWFEFTLAGAMYEDPDDRNKAATELEKKRKQIPASIRSIPKIKVPGSDEQLVRKLKEQTDQANHMMATKFIIIESIAFYTAMPQLIAQILHHDYLGTAIVVQGILQRVLKKLPEQAMWPLAWLLSSEDKERADIGANIFEGARENLLCSKRKQSQKSSKSHKQHAANILAEARNLFQFLKGLATYNKCPKTKSSIRMGSYRGEVPLYEFIPPVQAALSADITRVSGSGTSPKAFPPSVPRIWEFRSKVTVMYSKARPKKLTALVIPGSKIGMARRSRSGEMKPQDRLEYAGEIHFLVKQEQKGDLRKDARVQDLNNVINRLMKSSHKGESASRNRQLRLRTFAVTCLSESTGMLEWVPATASLRSLIQKTYNPQASAVSSRRRGMRIVNFGDSSMRVSYETKCQEQYFKYGKLSKAAANFEECFLKQYPPVFYWWFVQKFQDPHSWYEARTLFTLSAAIWSGVGHVIGLGDRHSENILLDTFNGECVHVDFDCIFDKGLNLPKPEVVPFRLTANMLDAFGPTGADGVYTSSLKFCMGTLRDNRDTLLSVLEPFILDPIIDWKRSRSTSQTQSPKRGSRGMEETRKFSEAKRSVKVVDERLRGIYNLRNPNHRKIRRTDGWSVDQNGQLTQLLPLSVEGQVHKMIAEATNSENLVQLYVGWMPWV